MLLYYFLFFGIGPAKLMRARHWIFVCCAALFCVVSVSVQLQRYIPEDYMTGLCDNLPITVVSELSRSHPDTGPYCYPGSYITKSPPLMHRNVDESFIVIVGYGPVHLILEYIHVIIYLFVV